VFFSYSVNIFLFYFM